VACFMKHLNSLRKLLDTHGHDKYLPTRLSFLKKEFKITVCIAVGRSKLQTCDGLKDRSKKNNIHVSSTQVKICSNLERLRANDSNLVSSGCQGLHDGLK
jgi:hypothetical protein